MLRRQENTRSLLYYAGWAYDDKPDEFAAAASAARAAGGAALDFAAREVISVHGGIGATWEHDAPLFFRRAQLSRRLLGGTGRRGRPAGGRAADGRAARLTALGGGRPIGVRHRIVSRALLAGSPHQLPRGQPQRTLEGRDGLQTRKASAAFDLAEVPEAQARLVRQFSLAEVPSTPLASERCSEGRGGRGSRGMGRDRSASRQDAMESDGKGVKGLI